MSILQPAVVAGQFYPAVASELQSMLDSLLEASPSQEDSTSNETFAPPKVLIAPHAGYIYSGGVAASAYRRLQAIADTIHRVVLLGPAHRVRLSGIAASSADLFATPLGQIPLDREGIEAALKHPNVGPNSGIVDAAFAQEHSLEVHLPFLQTCLKQFQLLPFVVGQAKTEQVAELLDLLWGDEHTLIVISTDLSHFHPYEEARRRDQATSTAIEQLSYESLTYEDACGRNPLRGLLHTARNRGMHIEKLDLRNSGDTAGPKDRVVGYGSYALHE